MNQEIQETRSSAPLDPFVRARVLMRLRDAIELAETADAADARRLEAILEDAQDRVRAWATVASATGSAGATGESGDGIAESGMTGAARARDDEEGAPPANPTEISDRERRRDARPSSRCTSVLATGSDPADEFLLIPFGFVQVDGPLAGRDFEFTQRHGRSAQRWFERLGRMLAIDYEHQSIDRFNSRDDGLRPAAGWIGGLEVRDDGLWATRVTWTPRAAELLRSGEYRYFSPVIYWTDDAYSDVAALGPVALTNDPAMCGVAPLAASRGGALDDTAFDAQGEGRLGNEAAYAPLGAADRDRAAASFSLGGAANDALDDGGAHNSVGPHDALAEAADEFVGRGALRAACAEIGLLRKQIAAQEADAFIASGMRLGKILDSTSMDWRADYLRDARSAAERLSRAPTILPPGRVQRVDRHGRIAARRGGGLDVSSEVQERWGIEPADIDAFDRAVAAGRVRFGGAA